MTACLVCHAIDAEPLYRGLLTRCRRCRYVWADVALTPADVARLYGRAYFHGDEYGDYLADRSTLEKNFALRLRTLERYLTPSHRRLFEIGSAYGLFLNTVRERFETVAGIDIFEEGVAFARGELGLEVTHGDFLSADIRGPYDVVCAWDTIEHLQRPDAYLAKAAALMPPGGIIAVTTGDIASLNARVRGSRWRLIHPPTHVHYFSVQTLTRLLDGCGFDVVHQEHCGFYRSLGNMMHNIVALGWGRRALGERLRRSVVGRWHLYMNLFDIMYVIARRR